MDIDGSNQTKLVPSGNSARWSHDGTKFAYTSKSTDDIFLANANGSNVTRLTNHSGVDTRPERSHDGTRIVFSSSRDGHTDIYSMNADGSDQTNLTNHGGAGYNVHPTWSHDGSKIAFESNRDGNSEIYVMDSDGSNQTNITYHS